MKLPNNILIKLCGLVVALLSAGCETTEAPEDSVLPWGKPAKWEGNSRMNVDLQYTHH